MLYPVNSWKALQLFDPATESWQAEEVYLPSAFEFDLQAGRNVTLMLQLEGLSRLESESETFNIDDIFNAEIERQRQLAQELNQSLSYKPMRQLATSAVQFVIERATALGQNNRTILAGYPKMSDWGRDAMIALPGLLLTSQRFEMAKEVLTLFIKHAHHGLIPNYFSSRPEAPNYASLDATLWMFVAIYEYWRASQDRAYLEEVYIVLLEILQNYMRGNPHSGIKLDAEDGLLFSSERRNSMTWMNAQIGEWQATPRLGKAVEVQALWYNTLRIMAEFSEALGKTEGFERCNEFAEHTAKSLVQKFWSEEVGHLYDCLIDSSIVAAGVANTGRPSDNVVSVGDPTCRANQVIAVGLPFNAFSAEQTGAVLDVVVKKLVTPYGLRTITPDHPAYCSEYSGTAKHLAAARHNGCVYPWLVACFTRASMRLYDNPRAIYEMFEPLFGDAEKHCAGHLAEMYDGDAPHHPRGASAYAASAGAILQSWQMMQGKAA
jgi:predicted glycogen debranching enzyme